MSAQQGIDITSCLDEQSQALNLSAVSCRVDGVLARQTDCSLCCEWDESPQDSAKVGESSRFNFWRQNTKGEKNRRGNLDIAERHSLECNLSFGLVMGEGKTVVNSDGQKSHCCLQWQHCKTVRCSEFHYSVNGLTKLGAGCSFFC